MTAKVLPFNLEEKENLGTSVIAALLVREAVPLGTLKPFIGGGLYAIYYKGNFEPYAPLAARNQDGLFSAPIYVGRAVPVITRNGCVTEASRSRALFNRLRRDAENITLASNLSVKDFFCRFLVTDASWVPLGESLLIAKFMPLWNSLIDGFGNNHSRKSYDKSLQSRWDVIHSGRIWAKKYIDRAETAEQIVQDVKTHFRTISFPVSSRVLS